MKFEIYNALGERIATLVNEPRPAGYYSEQFDATGLASGIYIFTAESDLGVQTGKFVIIR